MRVSASELRRSASLDRLAELTQMYPGNVRLEMNKLRVRGLVAELPGGRYRSTQSTMPASRPRMVFCVTCDYPISGSLTEAPTRSSNAA